MDIGETPHEKWYFINGRWVYVSIFEFGLYANGVQINTEECTIMKTQWYDDPEENAGLWALAAVLWIILIALVIPIWEKWTW